MKTLLIAVALLMLSGCSEYQTMSEAEGMSFAACLEKGWEPYFHVTTSYRKLSCTKK